LLDSVLTAMLIDWSLSWWCRIGDNWYFVVVFGSFGGTANRHNNNKTYAKWKMLYLPVTGLFVYTEMVVVTETTDDGQHMQQWTKTNWFFLATNTIKYNSNSLFTRESFFLFLFDLLIGREQWHMHEKRKL
jgi:hypothetical protein